MRLTLEECKKPRHSSLVLIFTLSLTLLATYVILVPGIIRQYQEELAKEHQKIDNLIILMRENNRMLTELHKKVFHVP